MMMKKQHGSFSKVGKLITVLQKCNGKTAFGEGNSLISPGAAKLLLCGFLLALTAGLAAGVYYIQPFVAGFISAKGAAQGLMLALLIMTFALAIKDIVTVLYTANDLELLIPLPFSASQIVMAKLAVVAVFPVCLCFVVLNGVCLGFGIREGAGLAFYIGSVLSSILIPVTGIFAATLLVVLIFRIFGFIRNRDITMVLGGVFTLALIIAYIFISNRFNSDKSSETVLAVFNTVASISAGFPNISFMTAFMLDGSISGLLISIGVSAAVVGLAALAVKLFYISTALDMQNTGSTKKAVSKSDLEGNKKSSVIRALTGYESKSARRNPAYLIYGFAMTLIWPLLVGGPMFFSAKSALETVTFPLDMRTAAVCAVLLGITASCMACGFNVLAATAFSREGATFSVIRSLPVDFKDYYRSKRNFAMLICSLGSVGYVIIIGILCLIMGFITPASCWVIIIAAAISFMLDLVIVNCLLLKNSKKPYFTWDTETEISRKLCWINVVSIIIGLIAFIALMISFALLTSDKLGAFMRDAGPFTTIAVSTVIASAAISLILAVLVNKE